MNVCIISKLLIDILTPPEIIPRTGTHLGLDMIKIEVS